jgi:hypothetical protein
MFSEKDLLVLEYLEKGGKIKIGKYYKPKKEELTFRNDRGSVYNAGRKQITLRRLGFRGKSAGIAA